jgi:hypothetical protein
MPLHEQGIEPVTPTESMFRDAYSGNSKNRRACFWVTMRTWCTRLSTCASQFVTLGIECAGFDVRDELYELLADWKRPIRQWATGPKNNAILSTVMSREQRAVAGRQAIGSSRASNVDAFDEMELPGVSAW